MTASKGKQSDPLAMRPPCPHLPGSSVSAAERIAGDRGRAPGKRRGFTCGAFDLLHAGHAQMLEECKRLCDYLIVGVQSDPTIDRPEKNRPVQSLCERISMVRAIRWVDEVLIYDTEKDLLEILRSRELDVRIIGADWQGRNYTGQGLPIDVHFNSREHTYSTSELRHRVFLAEMEGRLRKSKPMVV
jgi:glycerol-3-phosphate cytidylyltransferase